MMRNQLSVYQTSLLYFLAIGFSIALSFFAMQNQTIINRDGLCYLLSAEQFAQFGLKQAMQFCDQASWPFYSLLIATVSRFSFLSFEQSAFFLNTGADALSVMFFVLILQQLNAKPRILLLGLLTILCAHSFASVRDNIVRDHGYWAGYLASLYFMLRYVKEERLIFVGTSACCLLIASLFRIEGLVFFFFLPIIGLLLKGDTKTRVKRTLVLCLPHLVLGVFAVTLLFFFADLAAEYSGRIPLVLSKIQHSVTLITTQFQTAKLHLLQYVLPQEAARDATLVMFLLLVFWYLIVVCAQFSWLYTGLFLFACYQRITIAARKESTVLATYFLINLLITVSFFAIHFFLSKRYLIAQQFILMLFVPYALNFLIEKSTSFYRKITLMIIFSLMFLLNTHLFFPRLDPHQTVLAAGNWIEKFVPETQTVYTNDPMILYYSKRERQHFFEKLNQFTELKTTPIKLNAFDYVIINTHIKEASALVLAMNTAKTPLARQFANARGEQILIYNKHLKERQLT